MAQRGAGYNNPAFCNQFDNSLYDYEYVPEIDPDSPELERKGSYRLSRQIAPAWNQQDLLNKSNSSSDGSVIIEERNNRRVTLICERRKPKLMQDDDGGYSHDISFESDSNNEPVKVYPKVRNNQQPTSKMYQTDTHRTASYKGPPVRRQSHRYEDLEPPPSYEDHILPNRKHRYAEISEQLETQGIHFSQRKPRAPSPVGFYSGESVSFPNSPNFVNEPFPNYQTSSPLELSNSFEMRDFSSSYDGFSQRQPPVGASAGHVAEPRLLKEKVIREEKLLRTPSSEKGHILTPKSSSKNPKIFSPSKVKTEEKLRQSVRRNISSSFDCEKSSPYRTTTQAIEKAPKSIITPNLQRKFADLTGDGANFQRVSRMFQSTTNIQKPEHRGYQIHPQNNLNIPVETKMKRNQSVPNFSQHFDKRTPNKTEGFQKLDYHLKFSPEKFSPLSKSRISLLDTIKSSSEEEEHMGSHGNGCLLLAALIQLLAGLITCGICFYLLSKLGRRYYLELGTISGFITTVLGALGFRSHGWKWLPNRNYVSGYIILAGFSLLNAASVVLIIIMKPNSGEPLLDVCAGAICAVSVIVVGLALTGLTMSGCCKSPPPDNRVTGY